MFFIVNLAGILFIIFIVWWFWCSHKKAIRIHNAIIAIDVKNGVYVPSRIKVSANENITLEFLRKDASSCSEYVVFDALNIYAQLPLNKKHKIVLGKLQPGKYAFTCQMQMYRGELIVADNIINKN